MWRSVILALACAALAVPPSLAQSRRPVPSLFTSGDCKADKCTSERWQDFLKSHGEAELTPGQGVQIRLTVLNAETCAGAKDTVDIRRIHFGAAPAETRNRCGTRSTPPLTAELASALSKLLADPEVRTIAGEFPIYCSDGDDGRTVELHLLEIQEGERYRLIEWDCEAPVPLRPLAAWFEDERPRLP